MARTTISIPDNLKAQMDKIADVNWSETAANAFRLVIERRKVRQQLTEGKKMNAAINRLRSSKQGYEGAARERGHDDGIEWARDTAEYGELKALAEQWPEVESCETNDALGAPGTFLRMIHDDAADRQDIEEFWANLGKEARDTDSYAAQYWDGFAEGAIEMFEKLEE